MGYWEDKENTGMFRKLTPEQQEEFDKLQKEANEKIKKAGCATSSAGCSLLILGPFILLCVAMAWKACSQLVGF